MDSGVEVAICGGGVIGYSVAWQLARRGLRVAVVERGQPGGEASTAAAGILSPQAEAHGPGPLLELGLASRALYPDFRAALVEDSGLDLGYRPSGVLMLAGAAGAGALSAPALEVEVAALRSRQQWQEQRQLRVTWLDSAALAAAEPGLCPAVAALHFVDDGQLEPVKLMRALTRAAARQQVRTIYAEVAEIRQRGGQVAGLRLRPLDGDAPTELDAERVVLCAGSWSSLVPGAELPAAAIVPVRGQLVELRAPELALPAAAPLRAVVFAQLPALSPLTGSPLRGYLLPRGDGRVLVGSTMERVGYVKEVTTQGLLGLLTLASRLAPQLAAAAVERHWSGLRPASADELPLLGPSALSGLFVCSGHFRNGISLAPISAALLTAQLTGEALPILDAAPFSPLRFCPRPQSSS